MTIISYQIVDQLQPHFDGKNTNYAMWDDGNEPGIGDSLQSENTWSGTGASTEVVHGAARPSPGGLTAILYQLIVLIGCLREPAPGTCERLGKATAQMLQKHLLSVLAQREGMCVNSRPHPSGLSDISKGARADRSYSFG